MDPSDTTDTYGSLPIKERPEGLREKLLRPRSLFRALKRGEKLLTRFSPAERLALYLLTILFAGSSFVLLAKANSLVSTEVPAQGGSLTEGIVGSPRFANPVLAVSSADQDVTSLVYSGLVRATEKGEFIPDLADSYEISEDGTTYLFRIREDARFHDGSPVTPEDVLFTVALAQNPDTKSPRRADWEGVTVSSPDARTVTFTLPHAYAPFLENATLGILPKHLWKDVLPAEVPFSPLNTHPVGSGPFRVSDVSSDRTGAVKAMELRSFQHFTLGKPYLSRIKLLFYPNERALLDAYARGAIDSFSAATPSQDLHLHARSAMLRSHLARTFGVFLNQNHATILAERAVRRALNAAVDKQAVVNDALGGYGVVLDGPIPVGLPGAVASTPEKDRDRTEEARSVLSRAGWKWNEDEGVWEKKKQTLSLTLVTADTPELAESAEQIARMWREMGVQVDVHVYPLAELNSSIIRPRNYDALLFGEVVGRSLDLFAFWHSSQRNDPGLNLALYANSKTDALLSKARAEIDAKKRAELYEAFSEEVVSDTPAVFLYAPQFIYVVPKDLRGVQVGVVVSPSERFLSVHKWYLSTEHVWDVFAKEDTIQ